MNLDWTLAGALVGLPVGTLLRGPVFRLSVRRGSPDRTACQRCGAALRSPLAAWCGGCKHPLGPPAAIEIATALVLGLILGRFGGQPVAAAFGFLGAVAVALAAIDLAVQRLPDRLTLPAYLVLVALLAAASVTGHQVGALGRALLGSLVLGAAYLVLALLRPGQVGGGDIKVAGLAGLTLGWLGWHTMILGGSLAFVLAATAGLALLAARRITLSSAICFGPFLLGGAILAMLAVG